MGKRGLELTVLTFWIHRSFISCLVIVEDLQILFCFGISCKILNCLKLFLKFFQKSFVYDILKHPSMQWHKKNSKTLTYPNDMKNSIRALQNCKNIVLCLMLNGCEFPQNTNLENQSTMQSIAIFCNNISTICCKIKGFIESGGEVLNGYNFKKNRPSDAISSFPWWWCIIKVYQRNVHVIRRGCDSQRNGAECSGWSFFEV